MKREYKLLLFLWAIEFIIVYVMAEMNLSVQSWIGNAIGTFMFLLPVQILLFLLGKDEKFTEKKKLCFRIAFWFINVCYLLGGVMSLT